MSGGAETRWIVVGREGAAFVAVRLRADRSEIARTSIEPSAWGRWVAAREAADAPRWVWHDTSVRYAELLAEGVRVGRCHDLRLAHAILRHAAAVPDDTHVRGDARWDAAPGPAESAAAPALFDLDDERLRAEGAPPSIADALAEFAAQHEALARAASGRLELLVAAESAGALVAAEMRTAGLPWDASAHERILAEVLGERVPGALPRHLEAAARRVREALGDPSLSLDSPAKLLRGLRRAGILVESTSRWELASQRHPAIEPLLEYKKLARLQSANGWTWLREWVVDGRFRPVYIPGGVVTGRWASAGGGALQLPRQLRAAVRADPGWTLVVADVAQLEPRVLAAMSRDLALAEAARGRDLYEGIVASGAVATRADAKLALLGAMYGATTGESGRLLPRLRRTYPRAMGLVDAAARDGEDGALVSTWLGRTSPAPTPDWQRLQARATELEATSAEQSRARSWARERGRFTRNFVVQGTAAEWALAWLADLRGRLATFEQVDAAAGAPRSGALFSRRAHIAFFLHDEVIVHAPAAQAERAAEALRQSAQAAGELLFGSFPVDFRLDVRIGQTAAKD
ncbi:bifunctional 3'-5' exonuclease/DNA polymerase [Microbacterium hominis]|uniref:bifunctional 3'-5' exonuclease/DNA polymerase n=1 Tax=Microbacterium hominis TaxID=162426 RepID=UPI0020B7BD7D|nr:bifunctional 3'-5' exonuclease/DNA polymerase [Microbacterium hominis]